MWTKEDLEKRFEKKPNYSIWSRCAWWVCQIANKNNAIIEKRTIDGVAYFRAKW